LDDYEVEGGQRESLCFGFVLVGLEEDGMAKTGQIDGVERTRKR